MDNVTDAGEDKVGGVRNGHGDFGREPRECVAHSRGSGVPHPDSVAAVAVAGGADIPAVGGVWGPCGAFGGFDVDQYSDSGRGKWSSVEVEHAVELGVGRKLGVDTRSTEEVERQFSLR